MEIAFLDPHVILRQIYSFLSAYTKTENILKYISHANEKTKTKHDKYIIKDGIHDVFF